MLAPYINRGREGEDEKEKCRGGKAGRTGDATAQKGGAS